MPIPKNITTGKYRMRVLCDGDLYANGNTPPPFDMDGKVGYGGSVHDFGINVTNNNKILTPTASHKSGKYKEEVKVTMDCKTEGALIYFTIDKEFPTDRTQALIYNGVGYVLPVKEGENKKVVLRMKAFKDGLEDSDVATYTYYIQRGWSTPGGKTHPTEQRYVTLITANTDNKTIPVYALFSPSNEVHTICGNEISVSQGDKITLTLKAMPAMKYNHATIFADWNCNYSFDDANERLYFVGAENKASEEVANFTRTISVPKDAKVGHTRIRVQYTDAWSNTNKSTLPHKGDEDVVNGKVYDIKLNITPSTGINGVKATEAKRNNSGIYNIMGIKQNMPLNKLPKGVYIVDGKKITI